MTDIHAFDADGTASPGAQTALNNATTGLASEAYVDGAVDAIPEATTSTAGLMAASDKAAMGDASALTSGTVPAARLPAATDADAGVVSLDEVSTRAATITQNAMSDAVTTDELFQAFYITNMFSTSDTVGNFSSHTLWTAPYDLKVTRVVVVFDKWTIGADPAKQFTFVFRNYDPETSSGPEFVRKSTSDEGVVAGKPWLYDAATWTHPNDEVAAGNTVRWSSSRTGDITFPLPVSITIGYTPL